MPAYFIAEITIHDPELFAKYRELALPTLAAHGAKPVVRAQECLLLEGEAAPQRLVIHEFLSREAALAWYRSDEYQRAAAIRWQAATSRVLVCDGV